MGQNPPDWSADDCGPKITPQDCRAKGGWSDCIPAMHVVDLLEVPADLPVGDYVLQYRHDSEQTDQVWTTVRYSQLNSLPLGTRAGGLTPGVSSLRSAPTFASRPS